MAPTANSMNNAMRVFRNQQRVLQDNAKALLEKTIESNNGDFMERRTKEMTNIYAVKNPRTKQVKSRAVLNPRDSMVTAKESL